MTATEEQLKRLVSFQTVTGDFQANNTALEYVADYLQLRGMYIENFEWNDYRSFIATTTPNQKHPKVMLYAHMDVVPGSKKMWEMRKTEGKIFGRGVID